MSRWFDLAKELSRATARDAARDAAQAWESRVQAYEAKGCSRSDAQSIVDLEDLRNSEGVADTILRAKAQTDDPDSPILHPEEHAWVERMVGRPLTNSEAQEAIRSATVSAAFAAWINGKEAN